MPLPDWINGRTYQTKYRYGPGPWWDDEITLENAGDGVNFGVQYVDAVTGAGQIKGVSVSADDDDPNIVYVTFDWSEPGYHGREMLEFRKDEDEDVTLFGVFIEHGREGRRAGHEESR